MNFLLRSSTQINPSAADASVTGDAGEDRDNKTIIHSSSFTSLLPLGDFGMGHDFKGPGEFGSIWTRTRIEDHYDFPAEEGSILIPFRDFPENWTSAPDMESLKFLDRDFIFPGEQFHILVHVRKAEESSDTETITPFKVAAAMNKLAAQKAQQTSSETSESIPKFTSGSPESTLDAVKGTDDEHEIEETSGGKESPQVNQSAEVTASPTTLVRQEGNKSRSLAAVESFRKSHYFARIMGEDGPLWKKRTSLSGKEVKGSDQSKVGAYGCSPVPTEHAKFDPQAAGGIARSTATCTLLGNGDIAVLLEVTMAEECISDDTILEVLQFEEYEPPPAISPMNENLGQRLRNADLDLTEGLLQWLLPLDRPSSPPLSLVGPMQTSPPKVALTPTNSNIFSFGHLRSASAGSIPTMSPQPLPVPSPSLAPPSYGHKEWDAALKERRNRSEVGSEGLLSFRGVVLEPQRFSAPYGLEGTHVPGKRWRRKLSVIQPIRLESYFAHCNTQDLICVLVENILPPTGRTAGVVIYVDSLNIVCQSAVTGGPPLPIPITCVEVGDEQLPGLPLRVGEQHSFILRPTSPAWKPSSLDAAKHGNGNDLQPPDVSQSSRRKHKDSLLPSPAGGQYAVIVSCRCSHTESRLYYKHSLQWRPQLPRDLLLSVSLESSTSAESSVVVHPLLKSHVIIVQATNLTSKDMNLTLRAPSSLANSPLSNVSFPAPLSESPIPHDRSQQQSFSLNEKDRSDYDEQERGSPLPTLQQLMSCPDSLALPPVQSMESVIGVSPMVLRERNVSPADIVANNSPARTHLLLQSIVPLGCVPAHSTTAVKCDVVPLTDGIITLDTLHISRNGEALYIPESPLQIYPTSSIATGVA